jgi:hypothetical protein
MSRPRPLKWPRRCSSRTKNPKGGQSGRKRRRCKHIDGVKRPRTSQEDKSSRRFSLLQLWGEQAQLQMNMLGQDEQEELEEGHQLLNVSFMQGEALPDNRAYLDGCSTVTAFKRDKYLKNLETV